MTAVVLLLHGTKVKWSVEMGVLRDIFIRNIKTQIAMHSYKGNMAYLR